MSSIVLSKPQRPLSVRAAAPGDGAALLAAIAAVQRETDFLGLPDERPPWAEAPDAHLADLAASGDGAVFIATEGAAIVGYLGADVPRTASCRGAVYIVAVGIREDRRGRGIGARLLAALEDWARARGAWRLELRVVVDNRRAQALYRRAGFEIEGRLAESFRIGDVRHDMYWMAKRLDDVAGTPMAPFDMTLGRAPYPPAVTVRALKPGDGAALLGFERGLLDGPPVSFKRLDAVATDVDRIERQIAATVDNRLNHVLVATDSQQRIVAHGAVWRTPWTRLAHDATVQLGVLRPWWGCGIGRQIAGRLEDWAAAQGLARLSLILLGHNRRGLRFAAARGFRQEVVSRGYARFAGGVAVDRIQLVRPLP
jgi:RimJ/RimL family protein N-acetyltransferase